jgi:hypothetical protein
MARATRDRAEDLEAVRLFLDRARRVEASTIVQREVGTNYEISWQQGEPWRFSATEPREELLKALLVDLRPLVVLGESVNLRVIFDVGERQLTSDAHRRAMREGRAAWKRAQKHGIMALRVDERDLSPEHVMRLWIGWYFHSSPENEAELRALMQPGQSLSRQLFLDYVYRALECVIWTASVLRDAIANDALET